MKITISSHLVSILSSVLFGGVVLVVAVVAEETEVLVLVPGFLVVSYLLGWTIAYKLERKSTEKSSRTSKHSKL